MKEYSNIAFESTRYKVNDRVLCNLKNDQRKIKKFGNKSGLIMWVGHGYVDVLFDYLIERRNLYSFPRIWFENNFELIKSIDNTNINYILL